MKLGWSIFLMVDIREQHLMLRRGEGLKNDKGYLCTMNMKEMIIIYLREVSDIGRKSMLQIW